MNKHMLLALLITAIICLYAAPAEAAPVQIASFAQHIAGDEAAGQSAADVYAAKSSINVSSKGEALVLPGNIKDLFAPNKGDMFLKAGSKKPKTEVLDTTFANVVINKGLRHPAPEQKIQHADAIATNLGNRLTSTITANAPPSIGAISHIGSIEAGNALLESGTKARQVAQHPSLDL